MTAWSLPLVTRWFGLAPSARRPLWTAGKMPAIRYPVGHLLVKS